jgi:hypothetical protein
MDEKILGDDLPAVKVPGEVTTGEKPLHRYLVSELSILFALLFLASMNIIYAATKSYFQISGGSPFYPDITLILLLLGFVFICAAALSFLKIEWKTPPNIDANSRFTRSIGGVIADAFFQNKGVIVTVAVIYGLIFALLDGILIYQPTVNFALEYGVSSSAAVVENCCGPAGYVPVGLIYVPAEHFGIQLIPVSVLIMFAVSVLVGINVALLLVSIRKSRPMKQQKSDSSVRAGKNSFLGGAVGALFGVFAGCPTCAAAFFLSMIAGSGATAFSLAISEFQPVIVLVSIPLLFGSILWQAKGIRTILLGCQL